MLFVRRVPRSGDAILSPTKGGVEDRRGAGYAEGPSAISWLHRVSQVERTSEMSDGRKLVIVVALLLMSALAFTIVSAGAGGLPEPVGPEEELPCVPYTPLPPLLDEGQVQTALEHVIAAVGNLLNAERPDTLRNCYLMYIEAEPQPAWT
jgi:hypothetical protein